MNASTTSIAILSYDDIESSADYAILIDGEITNPSPLLVPAEPSAPAPAVQEGIPLPLAELQHGYNRLTAVKIFGYCMWFTFLGAFVGNTFFVSTSEEQIYGYLLLFLLLLVMNGLSVLMVWVLQDERTDPPPVEEDVPEDNQATKNYDDTESENSVPPSGNSTALKQRHHKPTTKIPDQSKTHRRLDPVRSSLKSLVVHAYEELESIMRHQ